MIAESQDDVVDFLRKVESYPHPISQFTEIETHISHLFLTGDYAYKLKKAVKFDFLDFTTVDARKHFCEEEVRLNSRFAPELYLGVLPIFHMNGNLTFEPGGEPIEYVVRMRQFPENSLFEDLAAHNTLRESLLLQITDAIAQFHRTAELRPDYWGEDFVERTLKTNLDLLVKFCPGVLDGATVEWLAKRTHETFLGLKELIRKRRHTHVRAVHGDLHLRNMCVFNGKALLFDGIEFNPELSNCDVWADFAFFVMDLLHRKRHENATLVWNHYLQETDDFEGLQLLDLYTSYRAAVRAMVNCLALETPHPPAGPDGPADLARQYLQLAVECLDGRGRGIVAVGGLSGSGKSTLSSILSQQLRGVHVRSDAVRKHLFGVPLAERAPQEAYSEEMNIKTYRGLLERAYHALMSGRPVIVDAVFQSPALRDEIESLAEELEVPFTGIWCKVSPKIARERVRMRIGDISDADEAIITLQERNPEGEIRWHHLDTMQHERQTVAEAMSWITLTSHRPAILAATSL